MYKKIAKEYFDVLKDNGIPLTFEGNNEEISALANAIEMRCSKPLLPKQRESVAVPVMGKTKTAALLFDRVWISPTFDYGYDLPEEICCFGSTEQEIRVAILVLAYQKLPSAPIVPFAHYFGETDFVHGDINWFPRQIRDSLSREHKFEPVPVYASKAACDQEYKIGHNELILTAIEGLPLALEDELSWKQILEFRRDTEARIKYKRMVNWLDASISEGKSSASIEDSIAIKLSDYEWSLKKHGIKTAIGVISSALDLKIIAATSAAVASFAYAGNTMWATLGGAGIVVGKIAIKIAEIALDIAETKRGQNNEVAFIHEIQSRFGKKINDTNLLISR